MPIDSLAPVFSAARTRATVFGGASVTDLATSRFITAITSALTACGWTATSTLTASGGLAYPFGAPFVGTDTASVKTTVTCDRAPFLVFDGVAYVPYNPYSENATSCGPTIAFFAWGTDGGQSLTNLAGAITGNSRYIASSVAGQISLVAKGGGPGYNYPHVLADGRWGAGGVTNGGGYVLSSPGPATNITVTIQGMNGGNTFTEATDGRIRWRFTSTAVAGTAEWWTDARGWGTDPQILFTILANSNGFCFFDPVSDNHAYCVTSMLVQAPNVPTAFAPVSTFFVVAGFFRNSTQNWKSCSTAVNGPINTFSDGPYPMVICPRSPGTAPLITLAGAPLLQGAYIMYGASRTDFPSVVGLLWDCVVMTDYVPSGGGVMIDNHLYEVVSSQDGGDNSTRSSVLWRYN